MPSSSIIRDTVPEAPRAIPDPALLQAIAAEQIEEPEPLEVEELIEERPAPSWEDRWAAQAVTEDTADAIEIGRAHV